MNEGALPHFTLSPLAHTHTRFTLARAGRVLAIHCVRTGATPRIGRLPHSSKKAAGNLNLGCGSWVSVVRRLRLERGQRKSSAISWVYVRILKNRRFLTAPSHREIALRPWPPKLKQESCWEVEIPQHAAKTSDEKPPQKTMHYWSPPPNAIFLNVLRHATRPLYSHLL